MLFEIKIAYVSFFVVIIDFWMSAIRTKYIDIRGSKIRLLLIGLQPYIDVGISFFGGVTHNG